MGLFGKAAKGLFSGDVMSKFARAQALANDDYLGAARISSAMEESAAERRKAEAGAQQAAAIRNGLQARGFSQGDIDVIMANPDNASALVKELLAPHFYGAEGGTRATIDPATGQEVYSRAPSRNQVGRNIVDIGPDGVPKTIYEGVEPFNQPAGTRMGFLRGNGLVAQDGSTIPLGGPAAGAPQLPPEPPVGAVENGYRYIGGGAGNPANWQPVGGAGSTAPRGFR